MRKFILLLFLCLIGVGIPPISAQVGSVSIPIGSDSYKIVVSEDGIYEVSYEDLQAAGMDVAAVNPNTFEMMHKGERMAYQLIGDGDDLFEEGESVRFFGWAFDGSNHDGWYVDANTYWLWANGTATTVTSRPSTPGGTAVDTWRSTIVFEQDNHFNVTGSNDWDEFEFEGDAWFFAQIATNPAGVNYGQTPSASNSWDTPNPDLYITPEMGQPFREYTVQVVDPAAEGADAVMTTEVFSFCEPSQVENHTFGASLNGVQQIDQWDGRFGRSFDQAISASVLLDGDNVLRYDALTPQEDIKNASMCGTQRYNSDLLLPNRSILEYDRQLTAVDDQLLFNYANSGTHDFMVSGFNAGNAADAIVWEVTDRSTPSIITLSSANITDDGTFTWTIGDENVPDGAYIATSVIRTPDSVSQYVANSLVQPNVEWLAVSHANFMEQAQRLGAYRSGTTTDVTLSNGTTVSVTPEIPRVTHVADVEDVINQYGYGYNIPQAIQAYFDDAYRSWANGELKYAVLIGDATINPSQRECVEQCEGFGEWDTSFETFVATDLLFVDRFNGLMPTDHTFANLIDDGTSDGAAPEIAVGRFAVNTLQEATNIVDKVILYEHNQQIGAEYLKNLIFFADNADGGGDFCQTSRHIADVENYVGRFTTFVEGTTASGGEPYCLDAYIADGTNENIARFLLRDDVLAEINTTSAAIVNYRGHSSRFSLGGILNANRDVDGSFNPANGGLFSNNDLPAVWLGATSINSDFAYPSVRLSAVSERLMRLGEMAGAVGYWGSMGLNFDREDTALHQGFYEALNGEPQGPYTIGDAIVYSKANYMENELGNVALMWAFTYQGDPGMPMTAAPFVESYGDYEPLELPVNIPTALILGTSETIQNNVWIALLAAAVILTSVTAFNINRRTKLE